MATVLFSTVELELRPEFPATLMRLKLQLPNYELVKKKEKTYHNKMKADYD